MFEQIKELVNGFDNEEKMQFIDIVLPEIKQRGYNSVSDLIEYSIKDIYDKVSTYKDYRYSIDDRLDTLVDRILEYKPEEDEDLTFEGKTKTEELEFIKNLKVNFDKLMKTYKSHVNGDEVDFLIKDVYDRIEFFIEDIEMDNTYFNLSREYSLVAYCELIITSMNGLLRLLFKSLYFHRTNISKKISSPEEVVIAIELYRSISEFLTSYDLYNFYFGIYKMYPYVEGKVDSILKHILLFNSFRENSKEKRKDNFIKLLKFLIDTHNEVSKEKLRFYEKSYILHYDKLKLKSITSVQQYLSELKVGKNNVFRGHEDINYRIVPSVFRGENPAYEDKFIHETIRVKPEEFTKLNTNFKVLSKLQHYSTPTRLLDFTSNPLVALYFACIGDKDSKKKTGEVISLIYDEKNYVFLNSDKVKLLSAISKLKFEDKVLYDYFVSVYPSDKLFRKVNKKIIHEVRHENPGFVNEIKCSDLKKNYFIKGSHDTPRIIAQSGCFGIAGLTTKFNDEISLLNEGGRGTDFLYIIEGAKVKKDILEQLKKIDINDAKMFPELEKVAIYIKDNIHNL